MAAKKFRDIPAVIKELEPDKNYIIFLDKQYLDPYDRDSLADMLQNLRPKLHSIAVIGDGDPERMVHLLESRNFGEAITRLQDTSVSVVWPLPNYTGISLKDFDSYKWEVAMVEFFAAKVKEAGQSIRLKQEELRGETNAAQ